jgi:hypothetical protein
MSQLRSYAHSTVKEPQMNRTWLAILAAVPVGGSGVVEPVDLDPCAGLVAAIDATSRDLTPLRGTYDTATGSYSTALRLLPRREANSCTIDQFIEEEPWFVGCTEGVAALDVGALQAIAYRVWQAWTAIPPGDSANSYWRVIGGATTAILVRPPAGSVEVIVDIDGTCRETVYERKVSCYLSLVVRQRMEEDQ